MSIVCFLTWQFVSCVFMVCMKKLCILGYQKYTLGRFRSDCANEYSDLNLCWIQTSNYVVAIHNLIWLFPGPKCPIVGHGNSYCWVFVVCMKKLCILGYPKCTQRRFWSDCINAQADINLHWAQMSDGMFSDLAAFKLRIKKLCVLGYQKCTLGRFWSDCANAQLELNLCWAQMSNSISWQLMAIHTFGS